MSEIGEQVVALHAQGVGALDIAYRLNVAQSTVHYHLRRLNEQPAEEKRPRRPGRRAAGEIATRPLVGSTSSTFTSSRGSRSSGLTGNGYSIVLLTQSRPLASRAMLIGLWMSGRTA